MKVYDPDKPLIHIHIPKTAGISVQEIYKGWYGGRLLFHYCNEPEKKLPQKYDLEALHTRDNPVCLYGYFNRTRGFGVEHCSPGSNQCIPILREPFERVVSGYFYLRKHRSTWNDQSMVPEEPLRDYVLKAKGSMLNHFPREVTFDNYKEMIESRFVEIGIAEHLDESMRRIANKLKRTFDSGSLSRLNAAERDQRVPYELRDEFMDSRPLDCRL